MWVWDAAVGEIEGSGDGETFEAHVINTQFFFFFFWLCNMVCGILVPNQTWNLCSLQWKLRVLITGPPGKSQHKNVFKNSREKDFSMQTLRLSFYDLLFPSRQE